MTRSVFRILLFVVVVFVAICLSIVKNRTLQFFQLIPSSKTSTPVDRTSLASRGISPVSVVGTNKIFSRQDYEPWCKAHRNNDHEKSNTDNYEAPEPFEYLHDCCDDCNPPVPESPDPLVSVTWKSNYNQSNNNDFVGTPLQIYRTRDPVALYTIPATAAVTFREENSQPRLIILESCTVVMDWGSERAAWFELTSQDGDIGSIVTASISEYNRPYPGKTRELTKYGSQTYRLETNEELYEGVRFTFLHVAFPTNTTKPIAIDDFSIVSKIKPLSYTASFRSSNALLTKAWYWGAYGVRLNVERDDLNSILIERGDRVAIQGDGHPTIATVLTAFWGEETKGLLANVLRATDSAHKHVVDDGIMAYPLYWCLSAMDYYWRTPKDYDDALIQQLIDDIRVILDRRIDDFLDPNLDITWFGWDDRIGNGWCFHSNNDVCTREALLAFASLVIRVCNDLVNVLQSRGDRELVKYYRDQSEYMTTLLRAVPEFPSGFGVHAAAYAINAKVATQDEIQEHWMGTIDGHNTLNNAVTVCSFSQFNQYWILQAYGNIENGMEHALRSIELCWGPMMKLSTGGCFWEISSPEWLRFMKEGDQAPHLPSYCHPWASGVTPWLSSVVGGIVPLARGYQGFVAMPYVSEGHASVSTTTATPNGSIHVSAKLTKTSNPTEWSSLFEFEATVESSSQGLFGLRKSIVTQSSSKDGESIEAPLLFESLRLNEISVEVLDETVMETLFRFSSIGENHPRLRDYIYIKLDDSCNDSSCVVTATYQRMENDRVASSFDVSPFPNPMYPAKVLHPLDRTSQGDGLRLYGSDGYSLRGCNITNLPVYVQSISIRQHGFPGWVIPDERLVGYSQTDPVYLPLNNNKRVLGTVGIDDQGGGDINCILVDVQLHADIKPKICHFSIYFVAFSTGNKHAIRVMDGDTYDVIAPTTLIEDYEGGIWWTLETDRPSIRLKMMDIAGIHISAVAFSSTNQEN